LEKPSRIQEVAAPEIGKKRGEHETLVDLPVGKKKKKRKVRGPVGNTLQKKKKGE